MKGIVFNKMLSLIFVISGSTFLCGATPTTKPKQTVSTTTCDFSLGSTQDIFAQLHSSGVMTSPNWPGTYSPKTAHCKIALRTCQNCYIDFVFDSFVLPDCKNDLLSKNTVYELEQRCGEENRCDYLLIKDGNATAKVFTGLLTGQVHVPMSNNVKLHFCSSKADSESESQWKISYVIRETGIPKSCYYSVVLRHTCPDGECTYLLGDCAMKSTLNPSLKHPSIPDHALMGIVGTLVFISLVVILGATCNQSIRVWLKYIKYRLLNRSPEHGIETNSGLSLEDYSDVESESSDDMNSQGRDTLKPISRKDLPDVGFKEKIGLDCGLLSPWGHY